ncbi:MAG TPA: hypothetical protein DEB24_03765, partial [Coriobacteriia bacterium]|nr:hypothetical protein [Coriobacteriia bacterium]
MRRRSRIDIRRFEGERNKQLVFYSESNGFYKYFQGMIEWLLENSDITIHYVTGDMDDKIFEQGNPQLKAYYVGDTPLISFMM